MPKLYATPRMAALFASGSVSILWMAILQPTFPIAKAMFADIPTVQEMR